MHHRYTALSALTAEEAKLQFLKILRSLPYGTCQVFYMYCLYFCPCIPSADCSSSSRSSLLMNNKKNLCMYLVSVAICIFAPQRSVVLICFEWVQCDMQGLFVVIKNLLL